MSDFVVALGLVLVIEGLLWAAFPRAGRFLLEALSQTDESVIRTAGALSIALGVVIVWFIRG